MDTLRNRLGKRELLIGLFVSALAGCGTSRNQVPTATAILLQHLKPRRGALHRLARKIPQRMHHYGA